MIRFALVLALALLPSVARADTGQSARIIVPTAQDRALDIIARLLQPHLAKQFGRPVAIDNRPGEDGVAAVRFAAKSRSDEQLVLVGALHNLIVNPIHEGLSFEVLDNLRPVALIGKARGALLVRRMPGRSEFSDVVSYVKANKQPVRYGLSEGINPSNLAMLAIVKRNGLDIECLQYPGSVEMADALVKGRIDMMFGYGAVVSLALQNADVREVQSPLAETTVWVGVLVPRDTSDAVVGQVRQGVIDALHDGAVAKKLRSMYLELEQDPSPAAFSSFLKAEHGRWVNIVREAGLRK
jgi:tripartite-type tricarboxylate transporter receptor subunit TctC